MIYMDGNLIQKTYESRFTRFYESFWTPKKHGFTKEEHIFRVKFLQVK